jgi:hypothetical protein
MRRLLLLMLLLALAVPVFAQSDPNVEITFPLPVYDLAGQVTVRGTVNPADLQTYFLEAAAYDPDNSAEPLWIPVSLPATVPVVNGVIAQWSTSLLPDGVYQLRLHVLLKSGQSVYDTVFPLRIVNQTARPDGAAPGSQIVGPIATAAPTQPPPTPVPLAENRLPVPVGGHISNFNEESIEPMRRAGMTWIKWQIPYKIGDPTEGARDRINWSHERGFRVLLSVTGSVEELAEMGEEYYPVYAEFLGEIAALGPDAIEVWNEMNIDREWPTGQIDPRAYAAMLQPAYEAIKAVDPNIMVITGALAPTGAEGAFGLSRVWNDDRYYQGMANAGVADYADCIGVHYNEGIIAPIQQGGDPRGNYPTYYFPLMINRAAFPFRDLDIPLCFTELGYLSPEGYGPLPAGFAWASNTSVQEQAEWLRDSITIAGNDGRIELIIVWNVDYTRYDEDPQAGYAIIRADGTCPACDTVGSLQQ